MPVQSADRRHRDCHASSRGINEHHPFHCGVNIGRPNSCRIVFLARSEATQDQDADGDDRAGDQRPSQTYVEASRRITAATNQARAIDLKTFVTPSRNIRCSLVNLDETAGPACEIDEGRIPDRRCDPRGDGARDIGRIIFLQGIPTPECNSDTVFSNPPMTVLRYTWVAHLRPGRVECLSEQTGLTCIDNSSKRGFVLARGSHHLLG